MEAFKIEKKSKNNGISLSRVDHISVAVPDLVKASKFYGEKFGCIVSEPIEVKGQGVRIAYVQFENIKLELMEPIGANSQIKKFLERTPAGGLHHFCIDTDDIFKAARFFKDVGLNLIGRSPIKKGHHGKKLFFIQPRLLK